MLGTPWTSTRSLKANPALKRTAAPPLSFALEHSSGFGSWRVHRTSGTSRMGGLGFRVLNHRCCFFPAQVIFARVSTHSSSVISFWAVLRVAESFFAAPDKARSRALFNGKRCRCSNPIGGFKSSGSAMSSVFARGVISFQCRWALQPKSSFQ